MPNVLRALSLRWPAHCQGRTLSTPLTRGRMASSGPVFGRHSSQKQLHFSEKQSFTRWLVYSTRNCCFMIFFYHFELDLEVTNGNNIIRKRTVLHPLFLTEQLAPWHPFRWRPMILISEHKEKLNFSGSTHSTFKALLSD